MLPPWNVDNEFDLPAPAYRQWTGQSCWPPVHARLTSDQSCVCKEDKPSRWLAFVLSMNEGLCLQRGSGFCKPRRHRWTEKVERRPGRLSKEAPLLKDLS